MNLLVRLSFCAWAGVTLVSCESAGSAANLLMAPLTLAERTLGSVGRLAGMSSAAVDDPDSSSKSVAARGQMIEQRGDYQAPVQRAPAAVVAQR